MRSNHLFGRAPRRDPQPPSEEAAPPKPPAAEADQPTPDDKDQQRAA